MKTEKKTEGKRIKKTHKKIKKIVIKIGNAKAIKVKSKQIKSEFLA